MHCKNAGSDKPLTQSPPLTTNFVCLAGANEIVNLVQQEGKCLGFHRSEAEVEQDPSSVVVGPFSPTPSGELKPSGNSPTVLANGRANSGNSPSVLADGRANSLKTMSSYNWSRGAAQAARGESRRGRASEEGYEDYRGDLELLRTWGEKK